MTKPPFTMTLTTTPIVASPFELFANIPPEGLLMGLIGVVAAMFIVMHIKPVMIMGATLLYTMYVHMAYFGPHWMHILLPVMIATILRLTTDITIQVWKMPPMARAKLFQMVDAAADVYIRLREAGEERRERRREALRRWRGRGGNNGGGPPENN